MLLLLPIIFLRLNASFVSVTPGVVLKTAPFNIIPLLRKHAKGGLTYAQPGSIMKPKESNDLKAGYTGRIKSQEIKKAAKPRFNRAAKMRIAAA
jgi:hypothetical protein